MTEVYRIFSNDWSLVLDFSNESLVELYNSETYGGTVSQTNGFYHGKKWLNVNVQMWKDDIKRGNLFVWELYEDPKFPHWWLDKLFK